VHEYNQIHYNRDQHHLMKWTCSQRCDGGFTLLNFHTTWQYIYIYIYVRRNFVWEQSSSPHKFCHRNTQFTEIVSHM
jgi:hypothetical protein